MNTIITLALIFLAGLLLGTLFFGLLWLTVKKVKTSKMPALLFLGSFLTRFGLVLAGFYLVGFGDYKRVLMCLSGFIVARFMVMRTTKTFDEKQIQLNKIRLYEA
jgi:F1F0 ATPase subunit 2